jgi:hypothetical protein
VIETQSPQSHTPEHNAETLRGLGFSIIPLAANSKQPAIAWKPYQQRQATGDELNAWLATSTYTNLGIITGRISRLVVLDLDDRDRLTELLHECPTLTETVTVQTRRGYHLYYRIPPDLLVPTQIADGIDLKGEGAYVVAPGSVIDGHTYKPLTLFGTEPRPIAENELNRLLRFLNRHGRSGGRLQRQPLGEEEPQQATATGGRRSITGSELGGVYRACAGSDGRNHTLFRLACLARDHGWSQEEVIDRLLPEHIRFPAPEGHRPERPRQRQVEGLHTIASAFRRPPRPLTEPRSVGLPNNQREELFRLKLTGVVRVLEGLRLKGVQPGETLTRGRAVELLRGIVGRDSVHEAINTTLPGGERVFSPQPPQTSVAPVPGPEEISTCVEIGRKSSGKSPHRPAQTFLMPTNRQLADRLKLPLSTLSDPLTLADLREAHITRQRCHELFLRRRPGQYPVGLFAARLGVSERTIRSYNRQNPAIRGRKCLQETPLRRDNVEAAIPDELPHGGFWLMDEKKNKYPAKREIAWRLLGQGERVSLFRQLPNYWYVEGHRPEIPPAAPSQSKPATHPTPPNSQPPPLAELFCEEAEVVVVPVPVKPRQRDRVKPSSPPPVAKARRIASGKRKLKDPLAEAYAQQVYEQVYELSQDREGRISLRSARRLVDEYGTGAVKQALERVARRASVYKPVGLLVTILRSERRPVGRNLRIHS